MADIEREIATRDRHATIEAEPGVFTDGEQMDFEWLKTAGLGGAAITKFTAAYANRAAALADCLDNLLSEADASEDWEAWRLKSDREGIFWLESPVFTQVRADQNIPVSRRQPVRQARLQISPPSPKSDKALAVVEMYGAAQDTDPGGLYRGPTYIWTLNSGQPVDTEIKGSNGKFERINDHGRGWPVFNSGMKTILSAYVEFCPQTAEQIQV